MRNRVINELKQMALEDQNIYLICADLGYSVLDSFKEAFPKRFINVGISEQNMASVAAGLALEGNMVFVYSIGNFPTLRCIEQIRNDICYHNANVKILSVGGGFAYGDLGMTHHATEDIAMMRALPNMRVYVPADPKEAALCLRDAIRYDSPAFIRMSKGGERELYSQDNFEDFCHLKGLTKSHNDVVSIVACGPILESAIELKQIFDREGVCSGVYSAPLVKPICAEDVVRIAKQSKMIITMEEHNVIGGLGGAVSEVVASLSGERACVYRVGLDDKYTEIVGNQKFLRDYYGMTAEKVYRRIRNAGVLD